MNIPTHSSMYTTLKAQRNEREINRIVSGLNVFAAITLSAIIFTYFFYEIIRIML